MSDGQARHRDLALGHGIMTDMAAGQSADASRNGPDVQPIFGAIEQQRAHEYVAEQIRRQVGLGIIAPGEALPPERGTGPAVRGRPGDYPACHRDA